jgi:pimeloyl-ACP methyl ester carboxylesterase
MRSKDESVRDEVTSASAFPCHYRTAGAGARTPVVFVSGAFQTMDSWQKFAQHFVRKTRVLLADLPGTGRSGVLPRRYGLDFLADATRSVLDAAGIGRACVISASYGSPIAYRFAQLYPERVERLVLAGVMKEIPSEFRARTAHTLTTLAEGRMSDFASEVVEGLLCRDLGKTVEKRKLAERLLLRQLERMSPGDCERYLENTARLLDHAPLDLAAAPAAPALVFTRASAVPSPPSRRA